MTDLIVDIATAKVPPISRETQLQAIRVLARNNALDLVPMLFAPMGPTYDNDAWRRKQKREGK